MSATGYEETDLSYHVADDDEEQEREENGEGGEEEDVRDMREDAFREQSASPPRNDEDNVRLDESHHQVPENRDCPSDGGEEDGQPPVMTIPPHVLSQILSSPGFSLQGRNLILPGHVPPIPVSLPFFAVPPPPSHYHQPSTPPASTSPLNLERRPKQRSPPTQQTDTSPHNLSLPKR